MKRFLVWRSGKSSRWTRVTTPAAKNERQDFQWAANFLMIRVEKDGEQIEVDRNQGFRSQGRQRTSCKEQGKCEQRYCCGYHPCTLIGVTDDKENLLEVVADSGANICTVKESKAMQAEHIILPSQPWPQTVCLMGKAS